MKKSIYWASYPSPVGALLIAGGLKGITDLEINGEVLKFLAALEDRYGVRPQETPGIFEKAFGELDLYFSGKPMEFTVPLDMNGTEFERRVWKEISLIPWGMSSSYGVIAQRAGSPGGARAAGGACGKNPVPIIVPCHRVLKSGNTIGGYTGGLEVKRKLLQIENVAYRR